LDGELYRQVLAVAIVVAILNLPALLRRAAKRLGRWARGARHVSRKSTVNAARLTSAIVQIVLLIPPLPFWFSVKVCQSLGLPVDVDGIWPTVVGALVVDSVSIVPGFVVKVLTTRGRGDLTGGMLLRLTLSLGVLWVVVLVFEGAGFDTGPWWRQLLVTVALTPVFHIVNLRINLTLGTPAAVAGLPLLFGYGVAVNGLMLWLVSWISTGMHPTLRIGGFTTYLLAAMLATAVMWTASARLHLALLRAAPADWRTGGYNPLVVIIRTSRFGYLRITDREVEEERQRAFIQDSLMNPPLGAFPYPPIY
jgi:hypothetical protein